MDPSSSMTHRRTCVASLRSSRSEAAAPVFRFVAFVWDDADSAARASAGLLAGRLRTGTTRWSPVLERKGLRVFCAGVRPGSSEAYTLESGSGVVLGKLFERGQGVPSTAAPLAIGEKESRRIVASRG